MRVLIACEYSGRMREAFRRRGHDVTSCDLEPSDDSSPFHIQGDVRPLLLRSWDLVIAHPPCTRMAQSANKHLWLGNGNGRQRRPNWERFEQLREDIAFFMLFRDLAGKVAIENSKMNPYAINSVGMPDQQLQPWMFGHTECKAIWLWLQNLPPIPETDNVRALAYSLPDNERQAMFYLPPSSDRWKIRSRSYPGFCEAAATTWG